ncbi:MAG TPA: hypothetical protein VKV16_05510 [Solirubrobacteraceae bacterium]|nr:hypothetical protein [Solirubrobacteraceae bacterium]
MLIEFEEILHDLELKRAAALAPEQRPKIDVERALRGQEADSSGGAPLSAPVDGARLRVRDEDGGERDFTPRLAGELVAEALTTLALASGEADADTVAGRAILRATVAAVTARVAGLGETVITAADLSALVEAALIDSGTTSSPRRSWSRAPCPRARRGPTSTRRRAGCG